MALTRAKSLYGRETLTYAPHFRYVIDLVLSDVETEADREARVAELPQSVREFMETPPSVALDQVAESRDLLRSLIEKIERRLASDIRVVDGRSITFGQYKAAVESSSPTDDQLLLIRAYEMAHMGVDGDPAVFLYRQLKSLAEDFSRFYGTLTAEAGKLQGDGGDLESAEAQMLERWIALEREAAELNSVLAQAESAPSLGDEPGEIAEKARLAQQSLARLDYERLAVYDTPSRQMFRVAEAEAIMLGVHLRALDAALGIGEAEVWEDDFDEVVAVILQAFPNAEAAASKLEALAGLLETSNVRLSSVLYDLASSVASALWHSVHQVLYEGLNRALEGLKGAVTTLDAIEKVAEMGSHSPAAEMLANLLLDALESYKRTAENLLLDLKRNQAQLDDKFRLEAKRLGEIGHTRAAARILRKIASAIRQASRKLQLDDREEVRRFLEYVAASNGWSVS